MKISSFEECVKQGGKVEERQLKDGRYVKLCTDCNGAIHGQKPFRKNKNKNRKGLKTKNSKINVKPTDKDLVKLKDYFDTNFRL